MMSFFYTNGFKCVLSQYNVVCRDDAYFLSNTEPPFYLDDLIFSISFPPLFLRVGGWMKANLAVLLFFLVGSRLTARTNQAQKPRALKVTPIPLGRGVKYYAGFFVIVFQCFFYGTPFFRLTFRILFFEDVWSCWAIIFFFIMYLNYLLCHSF